MLRRPSRSRKVRRLVDEPDPRSGAEETRTPDVLLAKEVLYQLSYGPKAAAPLLGRAARALSVVQSNAGGRFWTRTRGLCLIRAVL